MDDVAFRPRLLAGADGARHQGGHGDREADADRCGEEQDRARIADRGRKLDFAEKAQEIEVDQVDEEERDQAGGGCRGHHADMAKD